MYRFRRIGLYAVIARAKFYQTLLSLGVVPYQTYLLTTGGVSLNNYFWGVGMAVLAPLVLIAFSRSFNRMAGVVAFNPAEQTVRFGYLSFWGKRADRLARLDQLVPLTQDYMVGDEKMIMKQRFTE